MADQTARLDKTKQKLTDAYFSLCTEKKKATVSAVCQRTGYNRSTFYRHFEDISALRQAAEEDIIQQFIQALRHSRQDTYSAAIALTKLCTENEKTICALMGPAGDAGFPKKVKDAMDKETSGFLSGTTPMHALQDAFVFRGMLGTILQWFELGKPVDIECLAQELSRWISCGIDGTKGETYASMQTSD